MRRILFMFVLLLVLAGGFYAYVSMQAPTPVRTAGREDVGPRLPQDIIRNRDKNVGDVGPGERPWIKVYDNDRRLSHRFRAREYSPERAGRINVNDPEAEFFQYVRDDSDPSGQTFRTQYIQLVGKTGEVEVQQGPQASAEKGFEKGSSGPPKRGLLNDVTIRLFNRLGDKDPVTTITAPNVAFDNETFEIATRAYRNPEGFDVPADQVPIKATGDYEFRGRGLTMRWNDIDGRLEHLEVAHGEYLQITDPDKLSKKDDGTEKPAAARPSVIGATPILDAHGTPLMFAQAGKPKAAAAKAPKTQPAKPRESRQPPYRATFERDVRISEGKLNVAETQLASADLMYLDFRSGSDGGPATRPSTNPATRPSSSPATEPTTLPVAPATSSVATDTKEGKSKPPATKPAQPPIIVRWTGKLRIVPLDGPNDLPTPLRSGESVLRFVGNTSPVRLARDLNQIDCTAAEYYSGDRSVMVRGSERHGPVVLRQLPDPKLPLGQSRQATIVTQSLNYDGHTKVAVLHGKSKADIVMPAEETAATTAATQPTRPQVVTSAWNNEGKLRFKEGRAGDMSFDRADFSGDVDVVHPQLALKSQSLALLFEEHQKPAPLDGKAGPSTRPTNQLDLKQVIATTDVWADLIDAQGLKQTVTTDQLTVDMAGTDGKTYPKVITAIGNTHAFDEKQSLRAGGVELTMVPVPTPATRPTTRSTGLQPVAGDVTRAAKPDTRPSRNTDSVAVELQAMRAWDGVLVSSADGATAAGETMNVDVVNGQMVARLTGQTAVPNARPAVVTDAKGNTITGPVIDIEPKRQWAKIAGRGSIRAYQADDEPSAVPTQPAVAVAATNPTRPPKFVDVFWETQAELNGAKDRIFVDGPVLVTSTDRDGTLNTARGKRAVIELAARPASPATRPATGPSTTSSTRPAKSTTRPALAGLAGDGGMDLLKDKVVSAVNFEEDAIVNSTLSDDTGILRQFELKSDKVRYESGAAAGPATRTSEGPLAIGAGGSGRLIVPGPGTMIYRDHRPPTKPATRPATQATGDAVVASGKPAPSPEPGVKSDAPGQARGATAFQWKESLVYDQRTREALMTGDVVIVHQPDGSGEFPVRVNGDRALAIFEEKVLPRTPTTKEAKPAKPEKSADPAVAMQLKRLMMNGNLVVFRGGSELTAERMMYDPATGWMTAYGNARQPATYTDGAGQPSVWADEVHWNAQSWLTKFIGIRVRSGSDRAGLGQK